ncbi:hypothetical protein FAIPA1_110076 [Frankia sp. AiPs1]
MPRSTGMRSRFRRWSPARWPTSLPPAAGPGGARGNVPGRAARPTPPDAQQADHLVVAAARRSPSPPPRWPGTICGAAAILSITQRTRTELRLPVTRPMAAKGRSSEAHDQHPHRSSTGDTHRD